MFLLFLEVCLYRGRQTDEDYLPYFSSKATVEFHTFCGHKHSYACNQPLSNLTIMIGTAEHYHPEIQKIIVL